MDVRELYYAVATKRFGQIVEAEFDLSDTVMVPADGDSPCEHRGGYEKREQAPAERRLERDAAGKAQQQAHQGVEEGYDEAGGQKEYCGDKEFGIHGRKRSSVKDKRTAVMQS